MKKIISIAFLILLAVGAMAQNQGIHYQMVVRDSNGQLVVNRNNVSVAVYLLSEENGPTLYAERHTNLDIDGNGIIGFTIGNGTLMSGSYDSVVWDNAYLKTTVALSANEQYTETTPLTAVPYALFAETMDTLALHAFLVNDYKLLPPVAMDTVYSIAKAAIPTTISAFNNDVPFLTSFEESQLLRLSNDTIYITDTNMTNDTVWAVLPPRFSGDYNDLNNRPNIPDSMREMANDIELITLDSIPANVSAFFNNVGYITAADLAALETAVEELQTLLDAMHKHADELSDYCDWLYERFTYLKNYITK